MTGSVRVTMTGRVDLPAGGPSRPTFGYSAAASTARTRRRRHGNVAPSRQRERHTTGHTVTNAAQNSALGQHADSTAVQTGSARRRRKFDRKFAAGGGKEEAAPHLTSEEFPTLRLYSASGPRASRLAPRPTNPACCSWPKNCAAKGAKQRKGVRGQSHECIVPDWRIGQTDLPPRRVHLPKCWLAQKVLPAVLWGGPHHTSQRAVVAAILNS